jgi:hypothetical protein
MDEASNAASSSGDQKPPKSHGPAPKVSAKQIVFSISPLHRTSEAHFSISSAAPSPSFAYKIKTTAPKKFCVKPNQGTVSPGETVEITVSFMHDKMLQESQAKAFDFNRIAQAMLKDKFLVQTVALSENEQYPDAHVVELMREAQAHEQQGRKQEHDAAKSKADDLQHQQWEAFKAAKRVVDSKIGLSFVEASRSAGASGDDAAKTMFYSARSNANASPSDAGGGNSVSKSSAPGLARGASVAGEEGMSADLIAENLRLRSQLESQKEVLSQTQELLENLKANVDLRTRKNLENMSEGDIAKAVAGVAGTVYDKKIEPQSRLASPSVVQVCRLNAYFARMATACAAAAAFRCVALTRHTDVTSFCDFAGWYFVWTIGRRLK